MKKLKKIKINKILHTDVVFNAMFKNEVSLVEENIFDLVSGH